MWTTLIFNLAELRRKEGRGGESVNWDARAGFVSGGPP